MRMIKIKEHVFVTKLAGFEHSEYIQPNETKKRIDKTDIPMVQGKNIRDGIFVEEYDWYINKEISDKLIRSKLTKECILIPYVGSNLGEVGIFYHPYDCHLASNIAKIELIDDYFDIEFLKYYLQSPIGQSYLFQLKQGSAQPNITMDSIRETLIIDLPKEKQKKISRFLKTFDDKIKNNRRILFLLNKQLEDTFSFWFYQNGIPINGKANYEHSNQLPRTFKNYTFEKLGTITTGKKDANFATKNGEYNFYTCSRSTMKCDSPGFNCSAIIIAGNGDFNVKHYTGEFNAYQRTYVIEPKNIKYYALMYINAKNMVDSFKSGSNGSIVKFITLDDIKNINVVIPDDDKYLDYLNSIVFSIEKYEIEIEKIEKLKQELLPLLFNGQIEIED